MADTFLSDHFNLPAQSFVTFFQNVGILLHWHDHIGLANYVKKGNSGVGEGFEIINGISFKIVGGFLGEAMGFHASLPSSGTSLAFSFSTWPTADITDRSIGINAVDSFRIG